MFKIAKIVIVALFAMGGLPRIAETQQIKIGFIDTSRVLEECSISRQAKARLTAEIQQLEKSFEKKREQVTSLAKALAKPYLLLPYGYQADLGRKYRQSLRDFGLSYREAREDYTIRDQKVIDALHLLIHDLLTEVGRRGEFTVILQGNENIILYGAESINLTDQLIAICDKKSRESSLKQVDVQAIASK